MVSSNQGTLMSHEVDLPAAVQAELRSSSYGELRNVSCIVDNGQYILTGTVSTFYLKQMAQTILLRRLGNPPAFHNRLQVTSAAER
jgi:hypothetical protein